MIIIIIIIITLIIIVIIIMIIIITATTIIIIITRWCYFASNEPEAYLELSRISTMEYFCKYT